MEKYVAEMQKMSDRELMTLVVNDSDVKALNAILLRYQDAIYAFHLQRVGGSDDANDLMQETLVKVYLNVGSYSFDFTFGQWLFTIARNTFIDYVRKRRENILSIDSTYMQSQVRVLADNFSISPEEHYIRLQNKAVLDKLLSRLNERYRKMIMLRYFNEYSYEEIAEELKMPIGTVKTQIHRARGILYRDFIKNSENLL